MKDHHEKWSHSIFKLERSKEQLVAPFARKRQLETVRRDRGGPSFATMQITVCPFLEHRLGRQARR